MDEREKILLRKAEDRRFTQGCIWVGFAVIVELLLFQIKQHYIDFTITEAGMAKADFYDGLLHSGRTLTMYLAMASLLWTVATLTSGKKPLFPCLVLLSGSLVFFATCHGTLVYGSKGVDLLLLLVPAWGGLGLVYFLYQVEFFISALFTSFGGVGLWLYRQTSLYTGEDALSLPQLTFYVVINSTLLLIIGGFYLINKAGETGGILTIKDRDITLISDTKDASSLWLVGLSGVISLFSLALSMGLGSPMVAYYCTFALLGWLFVLLVYFTVKLM